MPWMASIDWKLLLFARITLGLFQCPMYPCTHMVLSKWAHPKERARIASITYSGTSFGVVLMMAISGTIAASSLGWPGIFYWSAFMGLTWSLLIYLFLSNSPAQCTNISEKERLFLESMPGSSTSNADMRVPWKQIITSRPMMAIMTVQMANGWGYWTWLTMVPTYMNQVLGFDIQSVRRRKYKHEE